MTGSVTITQLELIFPQLDWHIKIHKNVVLKLQINEMLFEVNSLEII